MLVLDGREGEGGGQVLRVALALATATGRDIRVENIRSGRAPEGLKAGHVAACLALAELSGGTIEGAEVGSRAVTLSPGPVAGGEHAFRIPTAGPVTLLAQALLPVAYATRQAFTFHLEGGTNVAWAPQWDDHVHVHLPLLARLGMPIDATLERRGFYPKGGGRVTLDVEPAIPQSVSLERAGSCRAVVATVASQGLPRHVVERAHRALEAGLGSVAPLEIEEDFRRGPGTGFAVSVRAECDHALLGADALGRRGKPVEDVVGEAVARLRADLKADVGVDVHQADQLPIFMALGAGGAYTTRQLSRHAQTVLALLPRFLDVRVETDPEADGRTRVAITRAA